MNCLDILEKIGDYVDKELDPTLCVEIEKHLEDCDPCVAFVNTLKKTVELFNRAKISENSIPEPVSSKLRGFLKENISTAGE
ncbi:MAG: zf-HC2 domain-containing protein [Nitrospinae bacterium]|nr:zf-HC2 domain-containing protein [Nitrospinota bacterium]